MTNTPCPRIVGLLGYPVEHSLSPAMHNAAFRAVGLDWRYALCEVAPGELDKGIGRCMQEGFAGWNVTVPHKESMTAYLDSASPEVTATGACNTVRVEDGRLLGENTDIAGFMAGLAEAGGIEPGSCAVLLGAGGAARAVAWALMQAGHGVLVLARNAGQAATLVRSLQVPVHVGALGMTHAPSLRQSVMEHGALDAGTVNTALESAALLVNCTPAGMWPHDDGGPLPEGVRLPAHLLVYDLVYRPRPTRLLKEAAAAGCRTQDGLAMLVRQGVAAFEIWTGLSAPVEVMTQACLDALQVTSHRKQEK